MKKYLALAFVCVMFLVSCAQKQVDLTLYSASDKKLFATIGENKEIIDNRLGTPKDINDGRCTYHVGNSDINVCYDTNNNACIISCLDSEFALETGIKVGDDMNSVYKAYSADKFKHKTILISKKDGKNKFISVDELDISDITDIYAISFGSSTSSGVVDSIILGSYKPMMYADYNRNIQ